MFSKIFAAVLIALVTSLGQAQELAPDVLVKKISEDVLSAIKADRDLKSGNIRKINELVETRILPYVDFQKMTASAVGRHWNTASAAQKERILTEFRQLLVYTYSGALSEVRDQTIQYRPLRAAPTDTFVEVRTQVIQPGTEPIQLSYRLEKTSSGWKIVDVNILGVWLVETYRSSFNVEINKSGVDGLIKTLADKNAGLARAAARGA